jgi:PAS domain-containing protein
LEQSIVLVSLKGEIIWFNNSFEMMIGTNSSKDFNEIIKSSYFDILNAIFNITGDEEKEIKKNLFAHEGYTKSLTSTGSRTYNKKALPFFDENEQILGTIISFVDISEQIDLEMEFERQHLISEGIYRVSDAALIVTSGNSDNIVKANPAAEKLFGTSIKELLNKNIYQLLEFEGPDKNNAFALAPNQKIRIKHSERPVIIQDTAYKVHSILNVNDMYRLLEKQKLDIKAAIFAQSLLNWDNGDVVQLGSSLRLTSYGLFRPCNMAGGDDYWFKHFNDKSLFVLRDHSGHDVACILRAMATDILHKKLLGQKNFPLLKTAKKLNDSLIGSGVFEPGQFVTGTDLLLDHKTLELEYISYGHPGMFHIRGNSIAIYPDNKSSARGIPLGFLPDFEYCTERLLLEPGDIILTFTDGLTEFLNNNMLTRFSETDLINFIKEITEDFRDRKNKRKCHLKDIINYLLQKAVQVSGFQDKTCKEPLFSDDITLFGFEIEDLENISSNSILKGSYILSRQKYSPFIDTIINNIYKTGFFDNQSNEDLIKLKKKITLCLNAALDEISVNALKNNSSKKIIYSVSFMNDLVVSIQNSGPCFEFPQYSDLLIQSYSRESDHKNLNTIFENSDYLFWSLKGKCINIVFENPQNSNLYFSTNKKIIKRI